MIEFGGIEYEVNPENGRYESVSPLPEYGVRKINKNAAAPRVYLPTAVANALGITKVNRTIWIKDLCLYSEQTVNALKRTVVFPPHQTTGMIVIPKALCDRYPNATHIKFINENDVIKMIFVKEV